MPEQTKATEQHLSEAQPPTTTEPTTKHAAHRTTSRPQQTPSQRSISSPNRPEKVDFPTTLPNLHTKSPQNSGPDTPCHRSASRPTLHPSTKAPCLREKFETPYEAKITTAPPKKAGSHITASKATKTRRSSGESNKSRHAHHTRGTPGDTATQKRETDYKSPDSAYRVSSQLVLLSRTRSKNRFSRWLWRIGTI